MGGAFTTIGDFSRPSETKRGGAQPTPVGLTGAMTLRILRLKTKAEKDPEAPDFSYLKEPDQFPVEPWPSPEVRAKSIERMKAIGITDPEFVARMGPSGTKEFIEMALEDPPNIVEALFQKIAGMLPGVQKRPPLNPDEGGRG